MMPQCRFIDDNKGTTLHDYNGRGYAFIKIRGIYELGTLLSILVQSWNYPRKQSIFKSRKNVNILKS